MMKITPYNSTRKTALAPDLRALDERAARAWTERMAVRQLADGRYAVDAESGATYVVDLTDRSCTCPDHQIRGEHCKHLRRVAIEITSHRVPPPGKVWARCDACGIEMLVEMDAPDPHRCERCRLDPDDVVVDRETGDRLIVHHVSDRRANDVRIGGADTTVAEYPTNEAYPADDIVVEARYPGDVASDRNRDRRYSFPLSRLERTDDTRISDFR